jgi:hypothetical protein
MVIAVKPFIKDTKSYIPGPGTYDLPTSLSNRAAVTFGKALKIKYLKKD